IAITDKKQVKYAKCRVSHAADLSSFVIVESHRGAFPVGAFVGARLAATHASCKIARGSYRERREREKDNITSPRQRRRRPCRSSPSPCCSSASPGTEAKSVTAGASLRNARARDIRGILIPLRSSWARGRLSSSSTRLRRCLRRRRRRSRRRRTRRQEVNRKPNEVTDRSRNARAINPGRWREEPNGIQKRS
ncbi:hypothetical protein ALC62_13906, partial [Cyphomyrmex costatus]